MSNLLILIIVLSQLACKQEGNNLILIGEEELIERIVSQDLPKPEDVVLKNDLGKIISLDSLISLEMTGEYFEDFYKNEKGEIVEIVIRKRTKEDKKTLARIHDKMNEGPEVKMVEIDCNDKANILQNVFERDQGMRKNGNYVDPAIDHENLEIIVSFLEKCGMPTLAEVNDIPMAAIWAVLQHSSNKWRKKYMPMLEKAAENGDMKWSTIALMKDRTLMNDGEPQIYGSQIKDGKLYDLFEPEYVNKRRAAIGMEPIQDYLDRWNITFDVPQKD